MRGTFRSLQSPNYRIWAAGALVSNIGSWMQRTAQDWIVLSELTDHRATAIGIVVGLQFAPQILLLPLTGFAADHLNRRKLLICTQGAMGLLALGLGLLVVTALCGCGMSTYSRFCLDARRRSTRRRAGPSCRSSSTKNSFRTRWR